MIFVFQESKPWRKGQPQIDPNGRRIEIRSRSLSEARDKLPFENPLKKRSTRVWIHIDKYILDLEAQIKALHQKEARP
jgi:hypothetical protein